jgi:4-aminobutyrate aminotransferase-like enzyme
LFLVSGSDAIEASVDLARKATGGLDMLGLHAGLHGSTSFLTRSLTFAWARRKHALVAPATSAILAPYCYRCPLGLTFPKCEIPVPEDESDPGRRELHGQARRVHRRAGAQRRRARRSAARLLRRAAS